MQVRALIALLQQFDPDKEVVVYDGDGGHMKPTDAIEDWHGLVLIGFDDCVGGDYSLTFDGELIYFPPLSAHR